MDVDPVRPLLDDLVKNDLFLGGKMTWKTYFG